MVDNRCTLPPLEDRPLVTFALFAYNQEKYIREAIEGALGQTYEPLEIIFSDDNSADRTFDIIQELVSLYTGPHRVRLNRNKSNMGISPHVRFIHELSEGEYIIHAAGDDISSPDRTEKIVRSFLYEEHKPSVVMSNSWLVDEGGVRLGLKNSQKIDKVFIKNSEFPLNFICPGGGATLALSRKLVESFEAPNPKMFIEDNLLLTRAHMTNGVLYIPDVLVEYRVNHGSITNPFGSKFATTRQLVDHHAKFNQERIYGILQFQEDADKIGFSREENAEFFNKVNLYFDSLQSINSILRDGFLGSTFNLIKELLKVDRRPCQIYVPIPYSRAFALYVFRWLPFVRLMKNLLSRISRE